MPRKPGSLNKPKFGAIPLSQLCNYLQADSLVPVEINFLKALSMTNKAITFDIVNNSESGQTPAITPQENIEFSVS